MTNSCNRILRRFCAHSKAGAAVQAGHLVISVLAEESLGGGCLARLGVTLAKASDGCFGPDVANAAGELLDSGVAVTTVSGKCDATGVTHGADTIMLPDSADWLPSILDRASFIARRRFAEVSDTSSEHLVQAMVEVEGPVRDQLAKLGVTVSEVEQDLGLNQPPTEPLKVDLQLHVDSDSPASPMRSPTNSFEIARVAALLDANLNRAREGLRVLDDFARFVLRSTKSTEALKSLRHKLVAADKKLRSRNPDLLTRRNVEADAGTDIQTAIEINRENLTDVVSANARRVQEALRSLEEFGKIVSTEFACAVKQLRYQSYTAEQDLHAAYQCLHQCESETAAVGTVLHAERLSRLQRSQLYVLLTESLCKQSWQDVVNEVLAGGADVIQLREKSLSDAELVARGRWIADACRSAGALFIMNDRPDLAVQVGADGVHLGQADGPAAVARQVVGESVLIGVSTHNHEQIVEAYTYADYIGVGPVFPSSTKEFQEFPGLELVRQAAESSLVPWFAIGGIGENNIKDVKTAGAHRIAVCNDVIGRTSPMNAARQLRSQLSGDDDESDILRIHSG